jgi:alpha-L-rhamnosidase
VLTAGINAHLSAPDGTYYVGLDKSGKPIATGPTSLNAASRQSDNADALLFGVVPAARIAQVERYVASQGMSTPPIFAGDLLQALGALGDDQTMLHLLTDASEPGWANILARGGTFGWEVWNPVDNDVVIGGTPLGSFFGNGDSMSHGFSSNVLVAIQQSLLGVVPTTPGFASFSVTPPLHALSHAAGTVPTPHGTIEVSWSRGAAGSFAMDVTVPPNTSATIRVPARNAAGVALAGMAGAQSPFVVMDGAFATLTVGGGSYRFTSSDAPARSPLPIGHRPATALAPSTAISPAPSGAPVSSDSRPVWPLALIAGCIAVAVGLRARNPLARRRQRR